jgi:hypothetical protein
MNHLKECIKNGKNICLYGLKGTGKSYIINQILEELNYNIIDVDPGEQFNINEINIENNITSHLEKEYYKNIILIDNLVLNIHDKFLNEFLSNKFIIPIILIFTSDKKVTLNIKTKIEIEFEYILWEYPKEFYYEYINDNINDNIKEDDTSDVELLDKLIDKCYKDLRQLKYILSNSNFKLELDYIESITSIDIDYDLNYRLDFLLNSDDFNISKSLEIAAVDTYILNGGLYQNYIKADDVEYDKISNWFSIGDIYNKLFYEEQHWDLYDNYIMTSVVAPSYYINKKKEKMDINSFDNYKEVSYNIINSYKELNNKELEKYHVTELYYVANIINKCIKDCEDTIKKYKKGKNTSKDEKINISNLSKGEITIKTLVELILKYDFYINNNIEKIKEDDIKDIDIKKLTRFVNIFSEKNNIKLSPLIDYILKYNLILKLKELNGNIALPKNNVGTVDLQDIWKF